MLYIKANQLLMEILKMHNQQGLESDNDSCNIDKKDNHPPLKRVWFIIFVVLIAIDTIMSGVFYCSEQPLDIVDGRTFITALILINTIGVVSILLLYIQNSIAENANKNRDSKNKSKAYQIIEFLMCLVFITILFVVLIKLGMAL